MAWSVSLTPQPLALAPCFIGKDCITAELIYTPAHCLELLWAVGRSERHPRSSGNRCCVSCVPRVGRERREYSVKATASASAGENTGMAAASAGENTGMAAASARREHWYGGCVSRRAINASAAPPVFFRPLRSCLAYPGLSKRCGQCEQGDSWHCGQGEEQYAHVSLSIPKGVKSVVLKI